MNLENLEVVYFAPRTVRKYLAMVGVSYLACALYASFLPLRFEQESLADSLIAFNEIPWLQLGLTKRADWFANGLLLAPLGFFFSGALNYGRRNLIWLGLTFGLLVFLITGVVCFIEWGQVFFPPRVRTLNDMLAGFVGGVLGVIIWQLLGNLLVAKARQFSSLPKGISRVAAVTQFGLALIALSSLMPLDIIMTFPEMKSKFIEGKINLIPLIDIDDFPSAIFTCIKAAWVIPAAIVWSITQGKKNAIRQVIFWAVLIETLTLPIYGRFFSSTDILTPIAMGFLSVLVSPFIESRIVILNRATFWGTASITWTVVLFSAVNGRCETVNVSPEFLRERLRGFLAVPYASAQRSTEFQAMENIVGKAFLFAIVGALLERTCFTTMRDQIPIKSSMSHMRYAFAAVVAIALFLEFTQIALPPLIVESSDVITYCLGGLAGVLAAKGIFAEE